MAIVHETAKYSVAALFSVLQLHVPIASVQCIYRTGGNCRAIPDFALFRKFCGY